MHAKPSTVGGVDDGSIGQGIEHGEKMPVNVLPIRFDTLVHEAIVRGDFLAFMVAPNEIHVFRVGQFQGKNVSHQSHTECTSVDVVAEKEIFIVHGGWVVQGIVHFQEIVQLAMQITKDDHGWLDVVDGGLFANEDGGAFEEA